MHSKSGRHILLIISIVGIANGQIETACQNVPSNNNFVRHSASCKDFYWCNNGIATVGACPDEYFFEPELQMCDYENHVDCTKCSPFGIQNIGDPLNTNNYIKCSNGVKSTMSCGACSSFDNSLGNCVTISDAECESQICSEHASIDWIELPNPNDCNGYFICSMGTTVKTNCAPTLYFNQVTSKCDFPENVPCENGKPIPPSTGEIPIVDPSTVAPTSGPTTGGPTSPTPPPITGTSTSTTTSPITHSSTSTTASTELNCFGNLTHIPVKGDCTKYQQCLHNIAIPKDCPAGMYWHQDQVVCMTTMPPGGC